MEVELAHLERSLVLPALPVSPPDLDRVVHRVQLGVLPWPLQGV